MISDLDQSWIKTRNCITVLLAERDYLIKMVNKLLALTSKTRTTLENMGAQAEMMMSLMQDLMNQAQLNNNTFQMVNEHFDCIELIKRCIRTLKLQAGHKNIQLIGPVFANPLDKYYFFALFSDESRYGQIILNFLTNSIKFTPSGGRAIIHLKTISISELKEDSQYQKISGSIVSLDSEMNAPDKEICGDSFASFNAIPQQKVERIVSFQMIFSDTGCGISAEN